MQELFERLDTKIDNLNDKVADLTVKTAENTLSLQQHMEQTIEVRKQTIMLREYIDVVKDTLAKSIEDHNKEDLKFHQSVRDDKNKIKWTIYLAGGMFSAIAILNKAGYLDNILAIIARLAHL